MPGQQSWAGGRAAAALCARICASACRLCLPQASRGQACGPGLPARLPIKMQVPDGSIIGFAGVHIRTRYSLPVYIPHRILACYRSMASIPLATQHQNSVAGRIRE